MTNNNKERVFTTKIPTESGAKWLYTKDTVMGKEYAEYVRLSNKDVYETKELSERVLLDLSEDGTPVGIEIL